MKNKYDLFLKIVSITVGMGLALFLFALLLSFYGCTKPNITPQQQSNSTVTAQDFLITMNIYNLKIGDTINFTAGGVGCSNQWSGKTISTVMQWSGTYAPTNTTGSSKGNIGITAYQSHNTGDSIVLKVYLHGELVSDTSGVNYAKVNWIDR